jgi:hypothetical protein
MKRKNESYRKINKTEKTLEEITEEQKKEGNKKRNIEEEEVNLKLRCNQ